MGLESQPRKVREARIEGDREALSAMGRAGARVAAMKRAQEAEEKEVLSEIKNEEAQAAAEQAAAERRDDLIPEEDK